MTEQGGRSQAELEAELRARGFEPTDLYTATGRFWRKQGGRPPAPTCTCHTRWMASIRNLYCRSFSSGSA